MLAVITGVAGQDGSYLAEYLISIGYRVIGITRRKSTNCSLSNLNKIINNKNFKLINGDILDPSFLHKILYDEKPNEWYNLAAMSHVGQSFKEPIYCLKVNSESVLMQLEAIKTISPYTKFYQASSSEIFGTSKCPVDGFDENSSMNPASPYAISKLSSYWYVKNYRKSHNIFACNGILFNHSSTRRGYDFATRKITNGIAKIKLGIDQFLKMGDLSTFRDEGHSKDYCRAMHLMLQQTEADDFIISTGTGATIEEMLKYTCYMAGLDIKNVYRKDDRFIRPSEVPYLLGNSSKARSILGWSPDYDWKSLLREMYENDLELLKNNEKN